MPMPESVQPPQPSDKEPIFRPETQVSDVFEAAENGGASGKRKVFTWIGALVLIVALAMVGYFFVYPLLFGGGEQVEDNGTGADQTPGSPTAAPHQSLFLVAPAVKSEVSLFNFLHTTITGSLQTLTSSNVTNGTVQEIAILDSSGNQVPFKLFLPAFVPSLLSSQLGVWFEDDFTAFVYYDQNGRWPGYVARLKNGINLSDMKLTLAAIEAGDLNKFYLAPVATFSAFKDGALGSSATRYAVGSSPGASFNYVFSGNYLIISSSFTGLKAVAPLLGI